MTPITAPPRTTAAPDAIVVLPGQPPVQRRDGPLRNGNPRGNPNLAPRCGAKARMTGCACQAPAMANGRCWSHGGKSTGPRTPEGLVRLARAHTTHGWHAQAGPEADLRRELRHARVTARRARLNGAAYDHLPWLPPGMAARLRADTVTELQAPKYAAQFQDAATAATPEPTGQPPAACDPPPPGHSPHLRRDGRGRFAPAPPRLPRGRQAERAQARAETAALAPWKLAIAQARMARRQTVRPEQTAESEKPDINPMEPRREEFGQDRTRHLPPGACPDGGTVRPDGATGEDSDTNPLNRDAGGETAGAASEGSDTNSMNRDAGGETAAARAEAPAAAVAPKGGAACEGSDTNTMNRDAGGGTAATRADVPAAAVARRGGAASEGSDTNSMNRDAGGGTAAARADAPAAAVAPKGGAASEGSDTNSMNRDAGGGTAAARADAPAAAVAPKGGAGSEGSDTNSVMSLPPGTCPGGGAGGGTAATRADVPAAALAPRGGAASEGSDTNSMNSGAGGGTAAARADAPAAAVAPKGGAASEGSDTNSMNRDAGGGTAVARADAPAAAVAPKGGAACEGSDTNSMNREAGGGTAGVRADAPAATLAPKGGAASEGSDTNSMNRGAGGGTAASDAILAALPNRAARRRWKSLQRRAHPAPGAIR
jgi:hypothetical protein